MNHKIILMFVIVFTIYLLANSYIIIRTWQALTITPIVRNILVVVFAFSAISFIIGMAFESKLPFLLSLILQKVGFIWVGGFLYALLFCLFFDILRLINHIVPFSPQQIYLHYAQVKAFVFLGVFLMISIVLFAGNYRYRHPALVKLNIETSKEIHSVNPLKIIMVSDIHLGYSTNKKSMKRYVEQINALHPDIVVCAGDLIDNSLRPVEKYHLLEEFNEIKAPLGVYSIPGNHEYIGDAEKVLKYISDNSNIKILRDNVVNINNEFVLIGRDDRSNLRRKKLSELMDVVPQTLPIILLDHQPYHLEESEANNIDLHLSGHTHDGQLWPINLIVEKIYEVGYGYKQKGNTHVYVSSGFGLWGPPFRIGTQSEMVLITLQKKRQ